MRFIVFVFALLSVPSCGGFRDTSVGHLAAHDLDCPLDQIELTTDMPFEKAFRGCGREVTYVRRSGPASPMSVARSADGWAIRPPPPREPAPTVAPPSETAPATSED